MANTVLRLPEVKRRTGLSRSSIYNRIAAGDFPRGFSLGGRARGWLEQDIEDWILALIESERREAASRV
jgi:prophage regulatory protein